MDILLLLLLWTGVLGRLSAIPDFIFKQIGYDLPDRISTKLIFLTVYSFVVIFILFNNKKIILNIFTEKLYSKLFLKSNKYKDLIIFSCLIIISSVISTIFSLDKTQAVFGIFYYVILLSIPFFYYFISSRFLKRFLYSLVIINCIVLIFAIVQFYFFNLGGVENDIVKFFDSYGGFMPISFFVAGEENVYLRPSSLLVDPNFSAVFSVSSMIILIRFISKKNYNLNRVLFSFGIISALLNVLITGSRTGILMIIVALVLYTIIIVVKFIKRIYRKIFKNIYSVSFPVIISDTFNRIKESLLLEDSSTLDHIHFALAGLKAFLSSPITGVGIGCYSKYYELNIDNNSLNATPHSAYFRVIAEMGIIGTLSFLMYFLYLIKMFFKNNYTLGIILLFTMFIGNITYDFMMTPWFWIFIGFMIYNSEQE